MHFFQFHVGDYRAATAHLSNDEDLAYRRLLDMYYDTEQPIPLDIQFVSRRLRLPVDCIQVVLDDFFVHSEQGWMHKRCQEEIVKYQRMKDGGRNGANKRWAKDSNGEAIPPLSPTQSPPNANQEPITNNHKPVTNNKNDVACPADVSPDCWEAFIAHRKAVKALVTERVVNTMRNEADKAGIPLEDALDEVVARGWKGFKAEWYKPHTRTEQPRKTQYQLQQEAIARSIGLIPRESTFVGETVDVEAITTRLG